MKRNRPPETAYSAAVVARDDAVAQSLELLLSARGFEVSAHRTAQSLLDEALHPGWLFVDAELQEGSGLDLVRALQDKGWPGVAVLMVEHGAQAKASRNAPSFLTLEKPFLASDLFSLICGNSQ